LLVLPAFSLLSGSRDNNTTKEDPPQKKRIQEKSINKTK
jgi:hypothetical protein